MLDKGGNNIKAEFSQNEQETGYQGYQVRKIQSFCFCVIQVTLLKGNTCNIAGRK